MAKWGEINCPRCAEADDLVQAAVAAKLTEAAQAARLSISEREEWPPKDGDVLVDDCMAAILALITPDAQAALNRVVWAERERGFWLGRSCGGSKAEIDAALAVIRKGAE